MSKVRMVIPKQNSPVSAIRRYCVECSGGGRKEVADCHLYHCPLFPYRFGMMPETYVNGKKDVEIVNEKGKVINHERKKRKTKVDES